MDFNPSTISNHTPERPLQPNPSAQLRKDKHIKAKPKPRPELPSASPQKGAALEGRKDKSWPLMCRGRRSISQQRANTLFTGGDREGVRALSLSQVIPGLWTAAVRAAPPDATGGFPVRESDRARPTAFPELVWIESHPPGRRFRGEEKQRTGAAQPGLRNPHCPSAPQGPARPPQGPALPSQGPARRTCPFPGALPASPGPPPLPRPRR